MSTLRTLVLLTGLGLALGGFSRFGLPAWRSLFAYSVEAGPIFASSVAPVEPDGGAPAVRLTPVITGLSQPTDIQAIPGRPHLMVVAEKEGRARIFDLRTSPPTELGDLLRLSVRSASEQGLLGIAFHPRFAENGRIFASYSTDGPTKAGNSRISAWTADPKAERPVARGERSLLEVEQPAPNHNGGQIVFGPDGLLYIAFGDGGRAGDPWGNAQNPDVLLGKMLRIDVDRQDPGLAYAIPPSNPFVGRVGHRAEIFALGLRNPWRFSFGPAGQLLTGDVGQDAWEEVNQVARGGNYGWNPKEGFDCFAATPCDGPYIDPVVVYGHDRDGGRSITGGVVVRGGALPGLDGLYVYADYWNGRTWALTTDPLTGAAAPTVLVEGTGVNPVGFALGPAGEVYQLDHNGGLYRIVEATPGAGAGFPTRLADTGCMDPADPSRPAPGLVPYGVNVPFWSDGATKERWLALPDGATLTADPAAPDGDLVFPPGSVLVKQFRRAGALIETRLLVHHTDGGWGGYSYRWGPDGDAVYVPGGLRDDDAPGGPWVFPSGAECLACHTAAAGRALGPTLAQLDGPFAYPNGATANQVDQLRHIGLLTPPAARPAPLPTPGTRPAADARALLDTNCAMCHRPGGPADGLDLRATTPLAGTGACDTAPQHGDLGLPDAALLAPGHPERSVLLARMRALDVHRMPPIGSLQVDDAGVATVEAWVAALDTCD
jgi:uncharacterized repeat protein (TIGR03806 family)